MLYICKNHKNCNYKIKYITEGNKHAFTSDKMCIYKHPRKLNHFGFPKYKLKIRILQAYRKNNKYNTITFMDKCYNDLWDSGYINLIKLKEK